MQQPERFLQLAEENVYGHVPSQGLDNYSLSLIDDVVTNYLLQKRPASNASKQEHLLRTRIAKLCKLLVEADGCSRSISKKFEKAVMLSAHDLGCFENTEGLPTLELAARLKKEREERWDGKGSRLGLARADIGLITRAYHICDAYIRLISRDESSHLKKSENYAAAFEVLYEEAGKHYDPSLVERLYSDVVGELIAGRH